MYKNNSRPVRRSNYHAGKRPNSRGNSFLHSTPKRHGSTARPTSHSRGGRGARKMPTFDPSQFINSNPVNEEVEEYTPKHKFGDFGLDTKITYNLSILNVSKPTPIQDQIIPEILNGSDVVGVAETGTGKTAAFLLPLIHKTLKEYQRQTLILTPTRELAIQIEQELKRLTRGLKIFSTVCVGGANIRAQINSLRRTNHFVIATPGRTLDLMERKCYRPERVTTVVLDEADRMLGMGFINPIRTILGATPASRETLLFSATMDEKTKKLIGDFMKNPIVVSVKKKDVTNNIKQDVVRHGHADKFETLAGLFKDDGYRRVIVFGSMKHSVEKLSKQLQQAGVKAESIHGNKSHGQRQRALSNFKSGHARVLVATDVAARGVHVDNVTHVINYDLPNTFEDYVHRIGRTGRGENKGQALTFILA